MLKDKLNSIEWKEFVMEDVFEEISSSPYSLDYNKLKPKHKESKKVAYVTRTSQNNGISNFIADMSEEGNKPIEGNCITIGLDTATVKYQVSPFYTGQNIHIVRDKKLNKYTALFLIPIIEQSLKKFGWGGYSATLGRFKKTRLMLPTKDNAPYWDFMENFMKEIAKEVKPKYKYIQHEISDFRNLEEVEWAEYEMKDIFDIKPGIRLTQKDMEKGNIPFIGATESNNGITNFVSNINKSLDSNVLGINYNGSVAESFYHPYKCIFSDDVKRLKLKDIEGNKYIYLFLKTVILQQKEKYTYGYKFNTKRMERQKILLPTKNNQPDWEFMEQYMKRIENDLYKSLDL